MKKKTFNAQVYEGWRGCVELPASIRTYFDGFADEYNDKGEDDKLLDLGYVLKRGYDLSAQIKACLYDRPHISEDSFKYSIVTLISHIDSDYLSYNGYDKEPSAYSIDSLVEALQYFLDAHYVEYPNGVHEIK